MEKLYREYNDDRANSNTGVRAMWALRGESPPLHTLLDSVGGMQVAVDYRANFQDKGPAGRHKQAWIGTVVIFVAQSTRGVQQQLLSSHRDQSALVKQITDQGWPMRQAVGRSRRERAYRGSQHS